MNNTVADLNGIKNDKIWIRKQKFCKRKSWVPRLFSLFRYARKSDLALVILGSILAVIHGVSIPVLGLVFGVMTNNVLQNQTAPLYSEISNSSNMTELQNENEFESAGLSQSTSLLRFSVYYLYLAIAVFVVSSVQTYCWDSSCERQIYRLRKEFFLQILRQDIAWFDSQEDNNLNSRLSDDLERVRDGMGSKMSLVIQYFSAFLSGIAVGLYVHANLTLFIVALSPLLIACAAFSAKIVSSSASRELLKYAKAGRVADEVLTHIKTVVAFGSEKKEIERYYKALRSGFKEGMITYYRITIISSTYYFIIYSSYGATLWFGSKLVSLQSIRPGDVFTVLMSTMGGALQLGGCFPFLAAVGTAVGSSAALYEIIDRTPVVDPFKDSGRKMKILGHIRFKNVSFHYPNRANVPVLRRLSLEIKPGQTVAFVGESGSGKSTIVSLLLRFYDPDQGEVFIDGFNIKDLNVSYMRSNMGLVSQEPVLFAGTILQNILFGKEDASFEEVVAAAKMANAYDFIETLPMKFNTPVGERGTQLSAGQKQRIAIARALVRNPRILLLDEATSALDYNSEAEVQEALDKAMKGRTTIVIAHRLSTIKKAQIIFVLKDGHVYEWGTHNELTSRGGMYQKFIESQSNSESMETIPPPISVGLKEKSQAGSLTEIDPNIEYPTPRQSELQKLREISVGRMLYENLKEWHWLLLSFFACLLSGCIVPIYAFLYGRVFHTFQLKGNDLLSAAAFWALMFLCLGILAALSQTFMLISTVNAAERLILRLRYKTFKNVLRQEIGWFDLEENVPNKIATKLAKDAPIIKQMAGIRAGQLCLAFATMTLSAAFAIYRGWELAVLLFVVAPIVAFAAYKEMKLLRKNLKRDSECMVEAGRIGAEAIQNIKTVQSLGIVRKLLQLYLAYLEEPYRESLRRSFSHAVVYAIAQSVNFLLYAATFAFGGYLIGKGILTPAQVYETFFVIAFSAASIGQISAYTQDFSRAKYAASQVFQLIDQKSYVDSLSPEGTTPEIIGSISFTNIHFAYPTRPDIWVLKGVNLDIRAGETVAIVGKSGGGKSTFVSLLERFYEPNAGEITIDGINIKEINLKHLRKQIGYVTQEPLLFSATIAENIAYGEETINMEAVMDAAKKASIHNFIRTLPEGYDTMVGGRESQMSGGQKQRIAIARALLRNPRILILDEATSALDTASELIVQEALDRARHGRTCIIIAHRLTTVENADKIVVLNDGIIAERGTHRELIRKGKLYYNLARKNIGR